MDQGRGWVCSCCLSECLKEEKEEMWRELPEDMKNGIRNLPDKTRSLSISFSTSIYMIYIIITSVNINIIVTSGPEVWFHQREELHRREHRAPHQATEENDWDDIINISLTGKNGSLPSSSSSKTQCTHGSGFIENRFVGASWRQQEVLIKP